MTVIRRVVLIAVTAMIAMGAVATIDAAPATAAKSRAARMIDQGLAWTNAYQVKHGCQRVRLNSRLNRAARLHSVEMATFKRMTHVGPRGNSTFITRARQQGYNLIMGENVAFGYGTGRAVVNTGWARSAPHRRNMLNCRSKAMGLGVSFDSNGVPYWTQMFGLR